nr:MAG TPA: hypothetical protein [Caudoviricetes sp.]
MLGIVLAPKNNAQKGLLLIKCECVHIRRKPKDLST